MISKNKIKEIVTLHQKKNREATGLFIVEGEKVVHELLQSDWEVEEVFVISDLLPQFESQYPTIKFVETDAISMAKMTAFSTSSGVLAVAKQKDFDASIANGITLCLDEIKDPGNLGTIIRIADWYGITKIVCSSNTVELYNPKTVQASMGSFLRVPVVYTNLNEYLNEYKTSANPIYGAVLNGENLNETKVNKNCAILMGSESHGISKDLLSLITQPIRIPSKGLSVAESSDQQQPDSLNVAMATAIICAVFDAQFAKL